VHLARPAVFIIVALLISFSIGRSDAPSPSPTQKSSPPPELERLLDALVGRWAIKEDNGSDKIRTGEEVWLMQPGGGPLTEEYRAKGSDGKDEYDYAAIWWDAKANQYHGIFCAEFSDEFCTAFALRLAGADKIEMTGDYSDAGKKVFWREIFHITAPNSFTQILELGHSVAELKTVSTIHAARLSK
jgi:hypothetical protein